MRLVTASLSTLVISLAACGQPASSPSAGRAEDAAVPETPDVEAAASAPASATREDVIAALRCHAVLSSAMANQIVVGGDAGAVVGIREQTRWFSEAQRRSTAAGLSETEFTTLMAETRAPMITTAQQAENRPLMEQCLANVPPL